MNIYTVMYDWAVKKNQCLAFTAQERECALPDSNQASQNSNDSYNKNNTGLEIQVENMNYFLMYL